MILFCLYVSFAPISILYHFPVFERQAIGHISSGHKFSFQLNSSSKLVFFACVWKDCIFRPCALAFAMLRVYLYLSCSECVCVCYDLSVFVYEMLQTSSSCSTQPTSCPLQLFPSCSQVLVFDAVFVFPFIQIMNSKIFPLFSSYFSSTIIQTNSERHLL